MFVEFSSDNIITNAHIFQNERQKHNIFESEEKYEYSSTWSSFKGESSIIYKIHSFIQRKAKENQTIILEELVEFDEAIDFMGELIYLSYSEDLNFHKW